VDSESARAKELVSWLRDEFTELRREFQLQQKLALWQPPSSLTPIGRHWDDALAAASAPGALRALLTSHVSEAPDLEQSVEMARAILSARFPAQKPPHSLDGVHVLAGPSGSGKTLMVARLARVHAAARGYGPDQIAVISLGDLRPGAWSQIQLLGAQAGVECFRAADASVAAGLLEELGSRRLVLVDTPGTGGKDMVSALQRSLPRLTAHLVVPADISVAALKRLTCDPEWKWSSLMVTKLDEATCAWGLIQAGPEAGLEISFAAAEPRAGLPLSGGVAERLAGAAIGNLVVADHADSD
jgi:flagellar biosynthesis GTPase FlhF